MKKSKIVIIGAGPAGLTSAYKLIKESKDYDITILEASSSIGGISKTVNYKGNRMDMGGHRFFSKSDEVNNIWQEIMHLQDAPSKDELNLSKKKTIGNPEVNDDVLLKRNRISRIYYLKKFFNYPVSLSLETIKNLGFVRTIKSGFSYLKSCLFKKKEDSLENFYINRFGKKLYSMFFEKYTEKLWGRHPKNISADWGSQRVKGLSIFKVISEALKKFFHIKSKKQETSLIDSFYYPKYGPGQMWELMATYLEKKGVKIIKNAEVTKINKENNKIKSLEYNDKVIDGDIFISSMPIKDLFNSFDSSPKSIYDIANNLPYRDFMTIGILAKKLTIKDKKNPKGLIPDTWIYIQEENVKMGRIQVFNNWSPYLVKDYKNTVWISLEYFCNENDDLWSRSDKSFYNLAVKELEKMAFLNKKDILDYHVERVKKAYPAYFDSYKQINLVIEYLNSIDNLYCIGRNGQHRYNNMDHSMLTGIYAAECIIDSKKAKNKIWNINSEKEYHEEKKTC